MIEYSIQGPHGREHELERIAEKIAEEKLKLMKTDVQEYRMFLLEAAKVGVEVGPYVLEEVERLKRGIK